MAKAKNPKPQTPNSKPVTGHDAFNNIISLNGTTVKSSTGYTKACKDAAEAKKHFEAVVANAHYSEYR